MVEPSEVVRSRGSCGVSAAAVPAHCGGVGWPSFSDVGQSLKFVARKNFGEPTLFSSFAVGTSCFDEDTH